MKIGIIGIGTLTLELARRSSQAGYELLIHNPRGNSLVRDTIERMESDITLTSLDIAATADIVILFIQKDDLETILTALPDMTGKIVLHSSSLIFDPQFLLSGIQNALTYKITANLLPNAHVVKLFNPINLAERTSLSNTNKDEIFFIADDADSKRITRTYLKSLNFQPTNLSGLLVLNKKGNDLKKSGDNLSVNLFKNYLN